MRLYLGFSGVLLLRLSAGGLVDRCMHLPADVPRVVEVVCEPSAHLRGNKNSSFSSARTQTHVHNLNLHYIGMYV